MCTVGMRQNMNWIEGLEMPELMKRAGEMCLTERLYEAGQFLDDSMVWEACSSKLLELSDVKVISWMVSNEETSWTVSAGVLVHKVQVPLKIVVSHHLAKIESLTSQLIMSKIVAEKFFFLNLRMKKSCYNCK